MLTVRKSKTREIKDVTLTRMDTALIADRRMLFEKFTSLKDRAIVDNDSVVRDTVDEVIALWSKMVQADALQEHQLHSNVKKMKNSLQTTLESMKTKLSQVQRMVVPAWEHQKLQTRVEELESALRKSCEENCLEELQSEGLQARVRELEVALRKSQALANGATSLVNMRKEEKNFQSLRIKEEFQSALAFLSAERAAYNALEQERVVLLCGKLYVLLKVVLEI